MYGITRSRSLVILGARWKICYIWLILSVAKLRFNQNVWLIRWVNCHHVRCFSKQSNQVIEAFIKSVSWVKLRTVGTEGFWNHRYWAYYVKTHCILTEDDRFQRHSAEIRCLATEKWLLFKRSTAYVIEYKIFLSKFFHIYTRRGWDKVAVQLRNRSAVDLLSQYASGMGVWYDMLKVLGGRFITFSGALCKVIL